MLLSINFTMWVYVAFGFNWGFWLYVGLVILNLILYFDTK